MNPPYLTRADFVLDALAASRVSGPRPVAPRTIVDVGCVGSERGPFMHSRIADSLVEGDHVVGIDVNEPGLGLLLEREETKRLVNSGQLSYEVMSVYETRFADASVDAVLLLEVLEHLDRPYAVLDELARILKPGGSLVVTYPNPLRLKKLIRYAFRRDLLDPAYRRQFLGAPDHKVFPHPLCFVQALEDRGFETRSLEPLKYYFRSRWLNRLMLSVPPMRNCALYIGVWAIKR